MDIFFSLPYSTAAATFDEAIRRACRAIVQLLAHTPPLAPELRRDVLVASNARRSSPGRDFAADDHTVDWSTQSSNDSFFSRS